MNLTSLDCWFLFFKWCLVSASRHLKWCCPSSLYPRVSTMTALWNVPFCVFIYIYIHNLKKIAILNTHEYKLPLHVYSYAHKTRISSKSIIDSYTQKTRSVTWLVRHPEWKFPGPLPNWLRLRIIYKIMFVKITYLCINMCVYIYTYIHA